MPSENVFISAATSEFGKVRDDLYDGLESPYQNPYYALYDTSPEDAPVRPDPPRTLNVIAQGKRTFKAAGGTTVQMLAAFIEACDIVIHLVGNTTGAAPAPLSIAFFRLSHPEVAARIDKIVQNSHWTGISYTQLEAYLALAMGKNLILAVKDQCPDTAAVDQRAHLERLQNVDLFEHLPNFVDSQDLVLSIRGHNPDNRFLRQPYRAPHISNMPSIYGDVEKGKEQFVGRQKEWEDLDRAWKSKDTKVIGVIAEGGMGKSTLVTNWLLDFIPKPVSIFAFSFYRQGQSEQQVDSDTFFRELAEFYKFEDGKEAPSAKGRIVAERVMLERSLLILDGLEPLQEADTGRFRAEAQGDSIKGQITDNGIKVFLETLAMAGPSFNGLCILTSRKAVRDLQERKSGGRYVEIELKGLTEEEGAELLTNLKVAAPIRTLKDISKEVNGHPLALLLTGTMIRARYGGQIITGTNNQGLETLGSIFLEDFDSLSEGAIHTFKALEQYVSWLQQDGLKVELDLINVIGLFDRAAEKAALYAMKKAPPIRGLTTHYCKSADMRFRGALKWLAEAGLIARNDYDNDDKWDAIESHPLIRQYFSYRLRNGARKRSRKRTTCPAPSRPFLEGHRRLYQHYSKELKHYLPELNKEMSALYRAISHCCLAGDVAYAFDELLQKRAWRSGSTDPSEHNYATRHLGMISADYVALTQFFVGELEELEVHPEIQGRSRFTLLTDFAVRMRSLGRLKRAKEALRKAFEGFTPGMIQEGYDGAFSAAQLSELELISGELDTAEATARRAVEYADQQTRTYYKFHARTSLADVLLQKGRIDEAGEIFREAKLLAERDPDTFPPFLYSQTCYRYGLYLCESGKSDELISLARQTKDWGDRRPHKIKGNGVAKTGSLLSSAIDQMILSEAYVRRDELDGNFRDETLEIIHGPSGAISQLSDSGYVDYLARGRNIAARFYTGKRAFADTERQLELNGEYARHGGMRLLEADYLIEKCRLHVAKQEWQLARESHQAATELSDAIGYRRRSKELEELKKAIP